MTRRILQTTSMGLTASTALAALVLVGCIEDLAPASLIERNRVLGAKVSVVGAPERAWPAHGETATVEWLVVDEAEPRTVSWAFVACAAAPVQTGMGFCAGGPLGFGVQEEPIDATPTLELAIPSDPAVIGNAKSILVLGVICGSSATSLSLETMEASCVNDTQETQVTLTVPIQLGESVNSHPSFASPGVELNGTTWAEPPAVLPFDDCANDAASDAIPHLVVGSDDSTIRVTVSADSRESYRALRGDPPVEVDAREAIVISNYATAGEVERLFSAIEADAEDASAEVDWALPAEAEVPATGLLVQMTFVARDRRDGIDWVRRALCVIP